ncbi:MAG: substrate-binding domain-containing protein [Spirochaeta sp.]
MRLSGWAVLLAGLMTAFSTASCGGRASSEQQVAEPTSARIGFSMDSFVVERWQRDRDAFLTTAGEFGAQVLLRTANENVEVQRRQLIELDQSGVDVLVVVPNDSEELSDTIEQIHDRGNPILAYDRMVRNTLVDGYISFDNQAIGTMMARAVVEAGLSRLDETGEKAVLQILIINGAVSDYNSYMINRGIVTFLRPQIESGQVELLDNVWLQAWRNEEAREAIAEAFDEFDNIDGVIAANDLIADAVVYEAAARGQAGRLLVSGMDGDLAAVQRVAEGTQLMTVYKPVEDLARRAVESAISLAQGDSLDTDETIFNGSGEIPFIRLEPVLVTRENIMETVIADGFHSYQDVYRNVPEEQRPIVQY